MDDVMELLEETPGRYGLYYENLQTGVVKEYHGSEVHLAASTIKIPILCTLFLEEDKGLDLSQKVTIHEEDVVGGSGILDQLDLSFRPTLKDLAVLMTVLSDNTATNLLVNVLGIEKIQSFLHKMDMGDTKFQRKMMDYIKRDQGLENVTTPRDMALLLKKLSQGAIGNQQVSKKVVDLLLRQQSVGKLPYYLPSIPFDEVENLKKIPPDGVAIAHKSGELASSEHDVGIFYTEKGAAYTLSIFSSNLPDPLTGRTTVAKASKIIYEAHRKGEI